MKMKILDFIDFKRVNTLLEGFNQTTGFVTAILDLEGNVLSKSGWRQICTDFHRMNPETAKRCTVSDTVLANKMSQGEKYHFYKCLNGLVDVAVPIIIEGDHVANLFSGQFFFEKPDLSFFEKQAETYGFDKRAYIKALEKVPVISQERVKTAMNFLLNMTEMISEMTFQKLEQIELNEQRRKNEEALRFSEEDLKESQRIAHVGSWRLDVQSNQVIWSDELYKMYGFDPSLPPPPFTEHRKLFTPESWDRLSAALNNTINTGAPYELELETVRTDKSHGWMWVHGESVHDASGAIVGLKGVTQDITLRKETEAEQEKLKAQLLQAQKMESVGRLAGGVAHDFNNMLTIILGNTEIIMEDMRSTDFHLENLEEIYKAAERSAKLTKQLLAFARKQIINPKVLNLNQVISEMLKMLGRLIGEDIDLNWLPDDNLKPIRIDPSQVDQILANLCVNARDAIKSVGKVTIETDNISFDEEYCRDHIDFVPGDYVMIAVTDNGVGMDKATLANIFEPFFTTKNADKGSGLGLATVFGIVKQNDGFINVYSEPGQGTTFKIYLPQYHETDLPRKENTRQTDVFSGTETILLVEDEPSILRLTRMMLERRGYKVLSASTPGKAIKIASESSSVIDMVITDVVMPEMNGRDLAKTLTDRFPDLKCLFMSGYTANVIAHHGVLDSGVQFINKPFSKQDLSRKVREMLNMQKTPHDNHSRHENETGKSMPN
ncbi:PocR ligand-binding domain-containing protein [Desulfospira joergensenii]|uniref:PocR ligand-binding domain-containing protein n=1 Tax=Desulfospira joergensenii TaxID=53329 RepID=UPI0003B544C8|nr:PocR ligand-binding domain-containing protein [Desulfospira joergensenii]